MLRGNMETIRAFYERWDRGDVPGFSELLAEDAEFVSPPGAIDPGGRRGPGGFVAVRRAVGNRFGSFSHEIRGLRDAQERVLASVVFRAEKSEGGGPTVQTEFHVWTLRDGGIVQLACTNFWTGFSDSHDEVHQSHDRPRVGRPRVVELVQPGRDSRARSAACSVYESDSAGPPAMRRSLLGGRHRCVPGGLEFGGCIWSRPSAGGASRGLGRFGLQLCGCGWFG